MATQLTTQQLLDKGNAMLKQTKAEGNKPFAGSSYEKALAPAIPVTQEAETPANVPQPPTPATVPDATSTNTGLAGLLGTLGMTVDDKGVITTTTPTAGTPATTTQTESDPYANLREFVGLKLGMRDQMPSAMDAYKAAYQDPALLKKQQEVTSLTGRINSIVNAAQAENLRLEQVGSDRDVTKGIYMGQQARVNREAAIQALPIQAQLAAAQGDLEMATTLAGKLFEAKTADATNEFNFQNSLVDSVFNYATDIEKTKMQNLLAEKKQAHDDKMAFYNLANEAANTAIEYGQSGLASKFMSLDASSPNFMAELGKLKSQLYKPMPAKDLGTWSTFADDTMMINSKTGEVRPVNAGGPTGGASPQSEQLLELNQILNNLVTLSGFSSAVGFGLKKNAASRTLAGGTGGAALGSFFGPIGTAVGGAIGAGLGYFSGGDATAGSARADFEIAARRLSDMFVVENLDKMKGVLTEKDIEILRNEGTTIGNLDQSEESWLKEKERLDAMVARGLRAHGITTEQAVHYGYIEPEDVVIVDDIWGVNTSTPAINFNY